MRKTRRGTWKGSELVSLTKKGREWDIDLSQTESESKWGTMRGEEKGDEME
jgi:hypothetical protein